MLTGLYLQSYQALQQSLHHIRAIAVQANPQAAVLQAAFLEAQQLFQQQIMGSDFGQLEEAIANQLNSYNIEINKQLRLLATDVMFLQAARQPITAQQRQSQMRDRIDLLLKYCEGAMGE